MIEKIVSPAVHYDDGHVHRKQPYNIVSGIVAMGYRHGNALYVLKLLYPKMEPLETIQGFITNMDRFVDRHEAYGIARDAGQIQRDLLGHETLTSEDLW